MKYPAESLTRDECMQLLDACPDSFAGRRNKALIILMWRAGLRLGEALALDIRNIDYQNSAIRVMHGKGDKARTVGMDPSGLEIIEQWQKYRAENLRGNDTPSTPLICTRKGGKVNQAYIRAMLPRLAQKAGVNKRVHAHMFRHTFAVDLTRQNVPIIHIQRLLGHSNLATTSIYLASLSPEDTLDYVRKRTDW